MLVSEHYRGQRLALSDLYAGLGADDLSRTVPGCPAWQVKDVLGHLAVETSYVLSGDMADAGQPSWTGRQVDSARDKSVAELVDLWAETAERFEPWLDEAGFLGWVFTYDVTMHGDDVREALGLPLGSTDTHAQVLDGILDRARTRADGLGTLTISAGDRTWVLGEGEPQATLTAPDEGELARVIGARRADDVVRAMDWTGDPEPWIPVLPLFRDR